MVELIATFFTLLLIPALAMILEDLRTFAAAGWARLRAPGVELRRDTGR